MKSIFKLLITICLSSINSLLFAQTCQRGSDYPAITNKHLAVFIIDFPDVPKSIKDNYFPTVAALKDTIFNGNIKKYLSDMSYGQFSLTGDVFGYFTHQNPGFVNGHVTEYEDILSINTINIPELNIDDYDGVLFVSINDAGLAGGRAGYFSFLLNGHLTFKPGVFVPIRIGFLNRDSTKYPNIENTLKELLWYGIPLSADNGLEGTSNIIYSRFDRTFCHELIHFLGIGVHADSRTNGSLYDFEPEVMNNNCKCYTSEDQGSLLSMEYGNKYDIMGRSEYGMSLNMAFRDYLGWTNPSNKFSIKDFGHYTTTIFPINNASELKTVEIRFPFKYGVEGFKNSGYFLEVRNGNDKWDKMLLNPQLLENNEGIMVMKTDGYSSDLLDMSPSPNINYYGQIVADIRDVVLKPGMVYENNEIKLSNVKKNADGSFKVDIDVFNPLRNVNDALTRKIEFLPNPTSGIVEISVNEPLETDFNIAVYNNFGSLILSIPKSQGDKTIKIDLSRFSRGIYLIKVNTTDKLFVGKIVKE